MKINIKIKFKNLKINNKSSAGETAADPNVAKLRGRILLNMFRTKALDKLKESNSKVVDRTSQQKNLVPNSTPFGENVISIGVTTKSFQILCFAVHCLD